MCSIIDKSTCRYCLHHHHFDVDATRVIITVTLQERAPVEKYYFQLCIDIRTKHLPFESMTLRVQ